MYLWTAGSAVAFLRPPYFQATDKCYVVGLKSDLNVSITDCLGEWSQPFPASGHTAVISTHHSSFDRDRGSKRVAVFERPKVDVVGAVGNLLSVN